jgi:hypothetical protein
MRCSDDASPTGAARLAPIVTRPQDNRIYPLLGVRGWADEKPFLFKVRFVEVLLRGLTRAFLPPLPPGEGWGEGECQATFIFRLHDSPLSTSLCSTHFFYNAMFTNAIGIQRRFTFALTPALSRRERGTYLNGRNYFERRVACDRPALIPDSPPRSRAPIVPYPPISMLQLSRKPRLIG